MMKAQEKQKILVIGAGLSGLAAARAMKKRGHIVFIQDRRTIDALGGKASQELAHICEACYFGVNPPEDSRFDMLILSPGVSPELPLVKEKKEEGAEITGELELAYRLSKGRFIAITGTNGKTTTTSLVGRIFETAGEKTHVTGNIGLPVISCVEEAGEDDVFVTEVSSFQLETARTFHPAISAILNLTPDHLDRHHTFEEYGRVKAKIFENQGPGDFLIINKDDPRCYRLADTCPCRKVPFSRKEQLPFGAFVDRGWIVIRDEEKRVELVRTEDLRIIGDHNVENALAASAIAYFFGIDPLAIRQALKSFPGVSHRIEYCGEIAGVKYYNDSKGTNVDATITALKAIRQNILLIAGGDAKGQDFRSLAEALPGRVKTLILMGRDGHLIAEAAKKAGFSDYIYCKDMRESVSQACAMADQGDTVLLSPACASWDMYKNYEERGDDFKACVQAWEAEAGKADKR